MTLIEITAFSWSPSPPQLDQPLVVEVLATVDAQIVFEVDLVLELYAGDGQRVWLRCAHQDQAGARWLPRGHYRWRLTAPAGGLPIGDGVLLATVLFRDGPHARRSNAVELSVAAAAVGAGLEHARLTLDGDPDPARLSWSRGHQDWFFRHFDHAAPTVGSYLLKDSELLRGRILDVGCGGHHRPWHVPALPARTPGRRRSFSRLPAARRGRRRRAFAA